MRAFVVTETATGVTTEVAERPVPIPGDDEQLIRVTYSGLNFKDTMVLDAASRVRRLSPLIGGVDAAGYRDDDATAVVVHGDGFGTSRDGGFAQYLVAPSRYVTTLPDGLSPRDAMIIGTAGFTAMQSIFALEDHGVRPKSRVIVTGATGGVGSFAVALLHARGYHVIATTGSPENTGWLHELGADEVRPRDFPATEQSRVLGPELYDAAVDCVGGATLDALLRSVSYGGAVAASGILAGSDLTTSMYPFIVRHVALLGIDSVECPPETRTRVWHELARLSPALHLERFVDREIGLDHVRDGLSVVAAGQTRGRIIVSL